MKVFNTQYLPDLIGHNLYDLKGTVWTVDIGNIDGDTIESAVVSSVDSVIVRDVVE